MKPVLLSAALALFVCAPSAAQAPLAAAPPPDLAVHVSAIASSGPFSSLERAFIAEMQRQVEARGFTEDGLHHVTLFLDAVPVDDAGEQIVLTALAMDRLPEPAVAFGAEHELFHTSLGGDSLRAAKGPPSGTWVRERVSRDWLEQFHAPTAQETIVVTRGELAEATAILLDRLLPPDPAR